MAKRKAYISKQRTFAYKTIQIDGKKETFQDLLTGAFHELPKARSRSKQLPEDEDRRRVANRFDPVRGMLTGAMFDYIKGQARNCIVEDDEADNFSISQVAPPAEGQKRKEFLDSIVYFAVLGQPSNYDGIAGPWPNSLRKLRRLVTSKIQHFLGSAYDQNR